MKPRWPEVTTTNPEAWYHRITLCDVDVHYPTDHSGAVLVRGPRGYDDELLLYRRGATYMNAERVERVPKHARAAIRAFLALEGFDLTPVKED